MQTLLIDGHGFIGSNFYKFINDFMDVDIYDTGVHITNPSYKIIPSYNEDMPSSLSLEEALGKKYDYVVYFNSNSNIEDITTEFFPILFNCDRFIHIPYDTLNGISSKNVEDFSLYLYRNMNTKGEIDANWIS